MAWRTVQLSRAIWGWGLAMVLTLFIAGPVMVVVARSGIALDFRPEDIAAIRFTVVQAALSALVSAAVALPVARALARRRFPGRALAITLLGAPFILPVIVAVLALLAIFGRGGVLAAIAGEFGVSLPAVYGLGGVVLAHVFLNVPLVTRYLLQGWQDIPAERFRLAASLPFRPRDTFLLLEWPMLRSSLPAAVLAVFLISTTSFAVALTLGGGPRATTIELAIYQAFNFDFDLARAAQLGLVQLMITGSAAVIVFRVMRHAGFGGGVGRLPDRPDVVGNRRLLAVDLVVVTLSLVFLLSPLVAIFFRGAPHLASLPASVWLASLNSLGVALVAAILSVAGALAVAITTVASPRGAGQVVRVLAYLPLALSPLVLGTGIFLIVNAYIDPRSVALPVAALVNAAVTLPFAVGVLIPVVVRAEADHGRLADSLGLSGWARLRFVYLPAARPALGFSAGLAAALSIGDLSVITLFSGTDVTTLPMQVYRLMGAYRMQDAAGAALWLLILSLAVFWLFDRGGRWRA